MKKGSCKFRSCTLGMALCLCIMLAVAAEKAVASTVQYFKPSLFTNTNTFRLNVLKTFQPGTAISAAGYYDVDISSGGSSTASYESRYNNLFARANVAEGSLKVLAENKRNLSRSWGAAAAMVDQYSFTGLPQNVNPKDLQLSISYDGLLDNRWASLSVGVIGNHGQKSQLVKGPKLIDDGELIIPLTALVLDPTQPFTLGIAATASTQGRKALASFENSLFIHFLANGVPIETTSTGGFHQASEAPLPHSLVLFGSAIVGLITFRKRSRAHRLG